MQELNVIVERLEKYSDADAAGIGRLMPFLSTRMSGEPMDAKLLAAIIDSPYHDQLVARLDGKIVGAATMNLLMGPAAGRDGYLEDFVTDGELTGHGIGDKVWQEMMTWCSEWGVNLGFTSHPRREEAHRFYHKHGAEVRDTTVFEVKVD